ncbi:MAG TPA: hypothetical protein VE959_01445 [Bryobacteraceae bacterium]|nr:hypothetical protein [Bryobacteraceae bacterium]
MASLVIRNLDESITSRLSVRAAEHGRSMEEEAREILENALDDDDLAKLHPAEAIRRLFAPLGGVELPEMKREPIREPPDFQ